MLRTDTPHSDIVDDEDFHGQNEEHPYEHISCPNHPDYKLQLLCTKENFSPFLLCIKCLINSDTQRQVSGDDLVYIHDAIDKGLSTDVSESQMQAAKAKLEKKFLEFSSVDYLGVYEQHSTAQLSKLDREISRIKESLDELHLQFKQMFSKQYKYLKNKQDELTSKVQEFIEEQEHVDTLRGLGLDEITSVIRKLTNARDYEKLVKALFDRGSLNEGAIEGTMLSDIFGTIDDLKSKVHSLRNFKIEMSRLEDIRHRIDSIEMLDYSLQAFPPTLNPEMLQTLDKIRNAEKKRGYLLPQKDTYSSSEKQKKSVNFEKRGLYSQSRGGNEMQIEESPKSILKRERNSDEKDSQRVRSYGRKIEEEEERRQTRNKKFEDSKGSNLKGNHKQNYRRGRDEEEDDEDEDRYRRKDDRGSRKHKKSHEQDNNRYSQRSSNRKNAEKALYKEKIEEEDNDENSENDSVKGEDIFIDDITGNLSNDEEVFMDEPIKSNEKAKLMKLSTTRHQKIRGSLHGIKRDIQHEKPSAKRIEGGGTGRKASQNKASSQKLLKSEQSQKKRGRRKCEEDDEDFDSDEAYVASEDENEDDDGDEEDDEDEEYEGSDGATSKHKKSKSDRGVHGLHDWINRRVTGYLIFQNTAQDDKHGKGGGDHLNRITGKKWKKLSKSEKEEYKSLAMNARVDLKKEFQDLDKDNEELPELQELVEKKLKKIKKE